jgi:hypothetical protein
MSDADRLASAAIADVVGLGVYVAGMCGRQRSRNQFIT